ncbi:ImmA/IrrE family metallo-endopeptidase [Mobiluncus mulieris]|uniref:ImmA/IrrE family metallo-endopeptidase n=1 Tax=Mobiluncus mulieris TaxID=2052 RepID=A0A7Y0U304_9ACTO|nr:ImmA/IrrE family metallo-endopeptidase [Mobiluncus mulieris]
MGLRVELTANFPPRRLGGYSRRYRTIWIADRLPTATRVTTLAHEIAHALLGHDGHQPPAEEQRADELARRLLDDASKKIL